MKTVINIVLAACVIGLIYVCYGSIMGPINFDDAKKTREKQVIARLIDIRKAQLEYRNLHNGRYTASFDTLIDFVKTAKLPFVKKEGVLSDTQLEAGCRECESVRESGRKRRTVPCIFLLYAGTEADRGFQPFRTAGTARGNRRAYGLR